MEIKMMYGFAVTAWLVVKGRDGLPFATPFATIRACKKARDEMVANRK